MATSHQRENNFLILYGACVLIVLIALGYIFLKSVEAGRLTVREAIGLQLSVDVLLVALTALAILASVRRISRSTGRIDSEDDVLLQHLPIGIAIIDDRGVLSYANRMFPEMFGVTAGQIVGRGFETFIERHLGDAKPVEILPQQGETTRMLTLANGTAGREVQLRTIRCEQRRRKGWIVTAHDVSGVAGLKQLIALYRRAMDASADAIAIADGQGFDFPMIYVNKAFEKITGYSADEVLGKNCRFLQGSARMQPEIAIIRQALADRKPVTAVLRNFTKTGDQFYNELRLAPVFDENNRATHYVSIMRDVTRLRHVTAELERIELRDPLTGVANRAGFRLLLNRLLDERTSGDIVLVKLNVEAFHEINTTFGYEAGDVLLCQIAERVAKVSDNVCGRMDGDTFAVAIGLRCGAAAEEIVAGIQAELARSFVLPGATLRIFLYVGYVVGNSADGEAKLTRQVAAALNEARRIHARAPNPYTRRLDAEISRRMRVTGDLQQAVLNQDFILHYQPKVKLATGAISGAEALIRWEHQSFGLQSPGRFVPTAEHTGLIVPIGEWAMREAARIAMAVNAQAAAPCPISVNVSVMQFRQTDVPGFVERLIADTGVDPRLLTVELTESLFADSSKALNDALWRLRDLGVGLSIDDFGTGYSSLAYLGSFPVTEIKIDRAFVQEMQTNRQKRGVIEAVARLGRQLDVDVVVEGIETEEERRMLLELGCDYGQGYLFCVPLDAADFSWLIERRTPLPVRMGQSSVPLGAI